MSPPCKIGLNPTSAICEILFSANSNSFCLSFYEHLIKTQSVWGESAKTERRAASNLHKILGSGHLYLSQGVGPD